MLDMKCSMVRLTGKQTKEYENNCDYRREMQRLCREDSTSSGRQVELHDVDGIVLEVYEPDCEWSHST